MPSAPRISVKNLIVATLASPLFLLPVMFYWFVLISVVQKPYFIDWQLAIIGPIIAVLVSYPFVFVFGIPTYLLLSRFGTQSPILCGMSGAAIGSVVMICFLYFQDVLQAQGALKVLATYGGSAALSGGTVGVAFNQFAKSN